MRTPRNDVINLEGRRFGGVLVLSVAGRHYYGDRRKSYLLWNVRCLCGSEYVTRAGVLEERGVRGCVACGHRATAFHSRNRSVRLPDGRTIADVALASGVRLDTVYHRWLRGWPVEHLGDPAKRGPRGLGGARMLDARRCTVYPPGHSRSAAERK